MVISMVEKRAKGYYIYLYPEEKRMLEELQYYFKTKLNTKYTLSKIVRLAIHELYMKLIEK